MARAIGSKNARTHAWLKIGDFMINKGAARMRKIMMDQEDEDFVKTYLAIIKYFKPAMQSSTVKQEGDINISVISDDETLIEKV